MAPCSLMAPQLHSWPRLHRRPQLHASRLSPPTATAVGRQAPKAERVAPSDVHAACTGLLSEWLKATELPGLQVSEFQLGEGRLTVAAAPAGPSRAAIAFALDVPPAPGPRTSANNVPLAGWVIHWGCTDGPGARWRPPPPDWHTYPPISHDAGGGAWQTPLAVRSVSGKEVQAALIEVPLDRELRQGGLSFVLKDDESGQWFKNEEGKGGDSNFFVATAGLAGAAASTGTAGTGARPQPSRANSQDGRDLRHGGGSSSSSSSDGGGSTSSSTSRAAQREREELEAFALAFEPAAGRNPGALLVSGEASWGGGSVSGWMVDAVAQQEGGAQRSLMHRFNAAAGLVEGLHSRAQVAGDNEVAALMAVAVWLRLSAARLLTWNRNYNVKPREISAAQDRLNTALGKLYEQQPRLRTPALLAMAAAGRGGSSDVGQRVRDEILAVQQRNNAKGGMMEEWHQKLHNNTSPDDVVICEALLAYIDSGLDINAYWSTLKAAGINRERLASFDRPIVSEPRFSPQQAPGLRTDLQTYLQALRAVHCGADLASSIGNVLGYSETDLKGKRITVPPLQQLATPELARLLRATLHWQARVAELQRPQAEGQAAKGAKPEALPARLAGPLGPTLLLLGMLVEARHAIRGPLLGGEAACGGRLRDVLFLDMALDTAARSALEAAMGNVRASSTMLAGGHTAKDAANSNGKGAAAQPLEALLSDLLGLVRYAVETVALARQSAGVGNEELVKALKWLPVMQAMSEPGMQRDRALQAVALVDRLKRSLSEAGAAQMAALQPTAQELGPRLGIPHEPIASFGEEVVRGTSAAPLSQVLSALESGLRRMLGSGDWQVVSRGAADRPGGIRGVVRFVERLETVQFATMDRPTVLVVSHMGGHEDVPQGAVAVLAVSGTSPSLDVLSHSAVRARNSNVLLAACLDPQVFGVIYDLRGREVVVSLSGAQVTISPVS